MSASTFTGEFGGPSSPRLQREKRPGPALEAKLIKIQALGAGAMLGLATFNLITDVGTLASAKAVLLAATASIAAYAVNRFAVEKGAELASRGFKLAAATSISGILATGCAMFLSTYSGLVVPDVQQRRLQDHGTQLVSYVGQRNDTNLKFAAIGPVLQVNAADLSNNLQCEIANSCISRRGEGGRGPVAKALGPLSAKAGAVLGRFEAGRSAAESHLSGLNTMLSDFQKTLTRTDVTVWQRQSDLTKIQARIDQEASALVAALPVPLLRAYATELAAGISMSDNFEAAGRINALLKKHADAISNALAALGTSEGARPAFPGRVGVVDTLHHIGDFASIASIVFVAELMLPLTIWIYAFLALRWRIEQEAPGADAIAVTPNAVEYYPPTLAPAPSPSKSSVTHDTREPTSDSAAPPRRRGRPPGRRS